MQQKSPPLNYVQGQAVIYLRYHLASPYIGALSQNADTFLTLNAGVTLPNTLAYAI